MKADDARPQFEGEIEAFLIKGRERLLGLRHRPKAKFIKIGRELCPHPCRRRRVGSRRRMDEEIQIKWTVCCLSHRRDVLPHDRRREPRTADRAQTAGVAHRRRERRRRKAAHRRLNKRLGNTEQFEEIGAWPHEITFDQRSTSLEPRPGQDTATLPQNVSQSQRG
jgi:hypothetical protein